MNYPDKFIWIELGLQTIHNETAEFIRRGYPLSCFEETFDSLQAHKIPVIVHVILGLPKETFSDMFATVRYLNNLKPFGIKLQLLHVLKGTDLANYYSTEGFPIMTQEEYLDVVIHCLELLSQDIVIHRVTGDGPKELLLAPTWSLNKRGVLNNLHQKMKLQNTHQGKAIGLER